MMFGFIQKEKLEKVKKRENDIYLNPIELSPYISDELGGIALPSIAPSPSLKPSDVSFTERLDFKKPFHPMLQQDMISPKFNSICNIDLLVENTQKSQAQQVKQETTNSNF